MNPEIDKYLLDGCMRCKFGATPKCKVNDWKEELKMLRLILLETDLKEELKWSVPCYTYQSKNVLILSAFKDSVSINFFKGALLKDSAGLLEKPGENSQAARYMKFRSLDQVLKQEEHLKKYILEAIELEKANKNVEFKKDPEPIPEELIDIFAEDPDYEAAFNSLTPGRKRSYILHISSAKQPKTRISRAGKCRDKVFSGKGFNEY